MISIVIPIYNEEKILAEHPPYFKNFSQYAEFIFVDGGSTDRGAIIAKQYGRVFSCQKGRASQMNYGAMHARYDSLFFLHADTNINPGTLLAIEQQMRKDSIVGGCLTQRIDKNGLAYRIIENQGNFRARIFKVFYGDQGIFVKNEVFSRIGGFPEVPIMEDIIFTKQLRKMGQTIVLPDKIMVSARRWEKKGIIKTMLLFHLIIVLFWLKTPLHKIKQLYDDVR